MGKFIDRQKLEAHFSPAITGKEAYTAGEVLLSIQKFPSEDVAPVVHAHWINYRGNYVSMDAHGCVDGECLCSACGDYLTASDEYGVRGFYCPNCGAKMDEEVE